MRKIIFLFLLSISCAKASTFSEDMMNKSKSDGYTFGYNTGNCNYLYDHNLDRYCDLLLEANKV